ncbi:MAG: DUF192 domain-containing protein [Patescibacteria group bacterium]
MALFGKTFLIVASVIMVIGWLTPAEKNYLMIVGQKLAVEIADTDAARARGLSGRAALGANQGLLFIFDAPAEYSFWMKEMNFPIDIIWIDEHWRVADISKNVLPESFPQSFQPARPVKYVLEVNVNWAEKNNLQIGESVSLNK